MTPEPATYPGYPFPAEVIRHAVWLYHLFGLSLRDVERILADRGVVVTNERGGRLRPDSVSLPVSGFSADGIVVPLSGGTREGRSPTGVTPDNGGEIQAAASFGR